MALCRRPQALNPQPCAGASRLPVRKSGQWAKAAITRLCSAWVRVKGVELRAEGFIVEDLWFKFLGFRIYMF